MALAEAPVPVHLLGELRPGRPTRPSTRPTADSPAFWLYTSGTTGTAKAAMHRHGAIQVVCETYGPQVLGITPDDRCLSAAKAFFAYGLGNSVLFPLSVGASAVLEPSPSRPDVIAGAAHKYGATLFFAGPTFFANMLRAELPADALAGVRLAASAGEALPAALYKRWTSHFGVDILDGIGMTEMLHIFLSNRPGRGTRRAPPASRCPATTCACWTRTATRSNPARPAPCSSAARSTATGYWSRYDTSRQVFQGEWLRTGDTYVQDADGYYACLGRTGDMLKASGIWVSPGGGRGAAARAPGRGPGGGRRRAGRQRAGEAGRLRDPAARAAVTEDELIEFCRQALPSFKRPRKVVFVSSYPTTATGKIRRVELRRMAATVFIPSDPPTEAVPS